MWIAIVAMLLVATIAAGLVEPTTSRRLPEPSPTSQRQRPSASPERHPDPGSSKPEPRAAAPSRDEEALAGRRFDLDLLLTSVEAVDVDLDDDEEEFVRFCFDGLVHSVPEMDGLSLWGFDARQRLRAIEAVIVADDQRCVLTGFPPGSDVFSYTLGVVDAGAVADVQDERNPITSARLEGSRSVGLLTTAPELVAVEVDEVTDRIRYRFDEELDETRADHHRLGLYLPRGEQVTSAKLISIESDTVTVGFDTDGLIEEGIRFFARAGAVRDRTGQRSVPGAVGGETAAPDLIAVRPVPDVSAMLDFAFDAEVNINGVRPGRFAVYTDSSRRVTAEAVRLSDARTVSAIFPRVLEDLADQLVLAVVEQGAATENNPARTQSTIGAQPLRSPDDQRGPTSGPDLIDVRGEAATGLVILTFDERLDDEADVDPQQVRITTKGGHVRFGQRFVQITEGEAELVLLFSSNAVTTGALLSIEAATVNDEAGDPNPPASLALSQPTPPPEESTNGEVPTSTETDEVGEGA